MNAGSQQFYQRDLDQTLGNLQRLRRNRNLMLWYQELYREMFRAVPDIAQKRVLEIGSGTSPLKMFLPSVITSDVLALEHLSMVFDCHNIADLSEVTNHSIDVITLTNVLHHLRDPIHFLRSATRKLAKGGEVFILEPYFSVLSYPLYKLLHHESVDFNISRPVLDTASGPLSSSNQAMPHMIFFSRPDWLRELGDCYDLDETHVKFFTSLAYMVTGGISRVFPVPHCIYRSYLVLDRFLARALPKLFASFFCVRLVAKR
ncbi:methyltransferase domain-containing protein [Nitratidesulfovibrio liaohensis]|uniref:Class I SAM-dependent methyltransferase n=1 Tax=Nitratidesulfovibrio liaohensis TaxID=2604158 RepID=A0ABY9R3C8_9BACT|nr:methyltransferase domain-containing protein [Nitratidesulfovibrio liaohensis]WMW66265.1 class I SAM-dependent methyltransferase [Nitratidesulfovibrio liaohensis]